MALVAFVSQSFVTQTHLHFDGSARPLEFAGRTAGAADLRADHFTPAPPINCAICQEIAHAGAYLVPPDDVLHVPAPLSEWCAVIQSVVLRLQQRSHPWHSRAPPHKLQT
jgi:hypothetical protein